MAQQGDLHACKRRGVWAASSYTKGSNEMWFHHIHSVRLLRSTWITELVADRFAIRCRLLGL